MWWILNIQFGCSLIIIYNIKIYLFVILNNMKNNIINKKGANLFLIHYESICQIVFSLISKIIRFEGDEWKLLF